MNNGKGVDGMIKKEYSSPEFNLFLVKFTYDALVISDPDEGVVIDNPDLPQDPTQDPFE